MRRPNKKEAALLALFCFVFVFLALAYDAQSIDVTLIPRLLALCVFLLLFVPSLGLLRILNGCDYAALRNPVVLTFCGYTVLTWFSLLWATNTSAGWTDAFRTAGVFAILCLSCLLFVSVHSWPFWLAGFGVAGALVSGALGYHELISRYGFGLHSRPLMEAAVLGRMSNINLYASYLNMLLPLCALGIVLFRGVWKILAIATAGCLLLMIVLLQSRAAYVGLAVGSVVAAAAAFFYWRQLAISQRARWYLLSGAFAALLGTAAFVHFADGNFIAERVRTFLSLGPDTVDGGRLTIWKVTVEMARDHWFTGVGAGNFSVRLHDYFDIDDPDLRLIHPNWVQPHNDFLWVLAEKGLLGLLLFLGIFVCAMRNLNAAVRQSGSIITARTAVALFFGISTYATGSFFDFPQERVNHQALLAIYLAASVGCAANLSNITVRDKITRAISVGLALPLVLVAMLFGVSYSLAAVQQERMVLRAHLAMGEGDWDALRDYAARAETAWKTLDPFVMPVAFLRGLGSMFSARHAEALELFRIARDQIPSRIYITKHLGILAELMRDYDRSIEAFRLALERNPQNTDTIVRLAKSLALSGRPEESLALLNSVPPEKRDDQYAQAKVVCERTLSEQDPDRKNLANSRFEVLSRSRVFLVQGGAPSEFAAEETQRLRDGLIASEVFGRFGSVSSGPGGAIFMHPDVEGPTKASFAILEKTRTNLCFWVSPLPPEAGQHAGTIGVEVLVDGIPAGRMLVDRGKSAVYELDLSAASELTVIADCANGSADWDGLLFGVFREKLAEIK